MKTNSTTQQSCEALRAAGNKANEPADKSSISEEEENKRGAILRECLLLRRTREHRDRVNTTWGTKTDLGLFRTVKRIIEGDYPAKP